MFQVWFKVRFAILSWVWKFPHLLCSISKLLKLNHKLESNLKWQQQWQKKLLYTEIRLWLQQRLNTKQQRFNKCHKFIPSYETYICIIKRYFRRWFDIRSSKKYTWKVYYYCWFTNLNCGIYAWCYTCWQ